MPVENDSKRDRGGPPPRNVLAWRVAVRATLLSLFFVVIASLILVFQLLPTKQVTLEEGDVSPTDTRAPRKITYVSQILTEEAQAKAEANVRDAYDPPDARIARQQVTRVRQVLSYVDSVRHDAYARAHPIAVEEDKPPEEQGTYLHPLEHGQPETPGLDYELVPDKGEPGGEP